MYVIILFHNLIIYEMWVIMVIEEIRKIKIKSDFFGETELNLFNKKARCSLVYGENGSGKSTICNCINPNNTDTSSYAFLKDDSTEIELSEISEKNIFVFTEEFVDENLKFSEDTGLKAIVMFGEQKELDNEIKKHEEQKKQKEIELEKKHKKLDKYNQPKSKENPDTHMDNIINILKGRSSTECWASRESKIRNLKTNAPLTKHEKQRIFKNKSGNFKIEDVKKEYTFKISRLSNLENQKNISEKFYEISIQSMIEDTKKLLLKEIEINTLSSRSEKIFNNIKENKQFDRKFYEAVVQGFSENEVEICPYCFQKIEGKYRNELIKDIELILNAESNEHKKELYELKENYENLILQEIPEVFKSFSESLFNEFQIQYDLFIEEKQKITDHISKKINNVYTPINFKFDTFEKILEKLNSCIKSLESGRIEYNKEIKATDQLRNTLSDLNCIISWDEIKNEYSYYEQYIDERKSLTNEINKMSEDANELSKIIASEKAKKQKITIAIDLMNDYLKCIFFDQKRLQIQLKNGKYQVLVAGKEIQLKKLSTGEKNIIGLCYFFCSINNGKNKNDLHKDKIFIVLDDPISSIDQSNKIGLYTFLRTIFSSMLNNNKNSKIMCLSHNLEVIYNISKIYNDIGQKCTTIKLKNKKTEEFNPENSNIYPMMLDEIFEYANSGNQYSPCTNYIENTIGNTMRKVLEAYGTFNYRCGMSELSTNSDIINKLENEKRDYFSNSMYRLVLNGGSHTKGTSMAFPYDDFYNAVDTKEKKKTAKDVLLFLYYLDEIHLKNQLISLYKNEREKAIQKFEKIEQWGKELFGGI